MRFLYVLTLILLGTISSIAKEIDQCFRILPKPQKIEIQGGKGILWDELEFVTAKEGTPIPVLGKLADALVRTPNNGKGVSLSLSNDSSLPESKEGYILTVNSKGVQITARDKAGLFYGCQTLEQLMEDSRDFDTRIPFMKITDYPDIPYRAVHFDNKHHLNTMKYYYDCIDKLARYKVNAVMWEVEDKLRYRRRPEIASPNAISIQEMQALSHYAMERNVEISPLIQGLGHASYILKHHWELREDPHNDWTFCPSNPGTYEVLFSLYLDAMEAMPYGRYLHIGGDEISAIGIDELCIKTGKSGFELQMGWLGKVCKFISEHGRTPVFWDDMPFKHAGMWGLMMVENASAEEVEKRWNTDRIDRAIDLFPKECVYMRWKYDDATIPANQKALDWYQKKGLKVMGATTAIDGLCPYITRNNSCAPYIQGFSRIIADRKMEGIFATAWDDGSAHWEVAWRGFIAQGEFGWNPYGRSIEAFKTAHAQREFGFAPANPLMSFLDIMEKAAAFFDHALIDSGERNPACNVRGFRLISLPEKNNPGAWSEKYKERIEQSAKNAIQHIEIIEGIKNAQKQALRNRYTLDVYEQTQYLLGYPSLLINALHEYDIAEDEGVRAQKLESIKEVCEYFKEMRANFEKVYSESRFMSNPPGYIGDSKHHNHLGGQTDNSDWWFLYEKPMIETTLRWINE